MDVAGNLMHMLLALSGTLAVLFALAWIGRRVLSGVQPGSEAIRIVATRSIGSRERLVLVDVAGEKTLLGVTQQTITPLRQIDAELPEAETDGPGFKAALDSMMRGAG